mmetsp:Transcript_3444/g.8077  ORF Transcript_3444/g.8077 Transcript_3444/m.8077 type:complete len:545 (+) Transcript_3444:51-1685(+)
MLLLWSLILLESLGEVLTAVRCRHGTFNDERQACDCHEGWSTAGITDTVDWLEGVCEQYHCDSDSVCQSILDIPDATCPVPGWNCYCGWARAGFENSKGECMGFMYTFSVWTTQVVEQLMSHLWKAVLLIAVFMLPFGRKRAICDHHCPSLWNGLRSCLGCLPECRGECVMSTSYTLDSFKDDLAWTLYVLDFGVWLYLLMACLYVVVLFIWSVVLWAMVFLVIIVTCVGSMFMGCGDAAGNCCEGCPEAACCDSCGPCDCLNMDMGMSAEASDAFFWGGPFPQSFLFWDSSVLLHNSTTAEDCCCCPMSCTSCLKPLAWLIYVFPVVPENAWGGFFGYFIFGTHHLTPEGRMYTGGNPVIEFLRMGWRRPADLHGDESWRTRVWQFISEDEVRSPSTPTTDRMRHGRTVSPEGFSPLDLREDRFLDKDVIAVGYGRAKLIYRPFDQVSDRCFPSSFEDYMNDKCWICQDARNQWDLWLSCRHLFCMKCSTEMLQRRMPCPLCRVASAVVLRGERYREANPRRGSREVSMGPVSHQSNMLLPPL